MRRALLNKLKSRGRFRYMNNTSNNSLLGEQLAYLKEYFYKIEPKLITLECFFITRDHYDYFTKYGSTFSGICEIADRQGRGLKEGIIKLEEEVYLALATVIGEANYVLGFAPALSNLTPFLLNSSQGRVFSVNYDGDLIPHEIKNPPEIILLNDDLLEEFQQDIEFFLSSADFYKAKKEVYKRSSLLYGPPGNGKTSLITWAATKFDKIFVVSPADASPDVAKNINLICADDESKLIILEDLDSLNEHNSELLNFVDGAVAINKSYFIGTTNYPENLHENILSRPSRFDLFLEVPRPNLKTREALLRYHLPNLSDLEYRTYSNMTKGLNASYFQEIATLKQRSEIMNKNLTIDQIIDKCKRRVKLAKTKSFEDKTEPQSVGFSSNED